MLDRLRAGGLRRADQGVVGVCGLLVRAGAFGTESQRADMGLLKRQK